MRPCIEGAYNATLLINGVMLPPLGRAKISPGDVIDFGGEREVLEVFRNVHAHA